MIGDTEGVFKVDGKITFHADNPEYTLTGETTEEHLHAMIRAGQASSIETIGDSFVYFNEYSVVSDPVKAFY
ncbi:hypothetical protein Esi_0042_0103 [Ectocarpus siliculosus]|uniref:Uncharacterized protein n=1 Tax=Ectocarpus siliculosus TaxID=2880 RepID=D7G0Y9_ECTSI|nr:hypothetical protein Esi_0042_0103 [Ectocarpus siliculosus]|eukprot:CBJ26733.1 hypothetical protein Esi_0042_0103 [Ectocarpus siliculosus]